MFAMLVFADIVQAGLACVAIVAGLLVMTGALKGFLNENHLHSLGKMPLAATRFWAYGLAVTSPGDGRFGFAQSLTGA